jgi:hypothetical protein
VKYKSAAKNQIVDEINQAKGINGVRQLIRRYLSAEFRRALVPLSPEFFLLYYLGFRLPLHQRKWITLWSIKFLLELAPRDHGKSWIFSYGAPLYEIYSNLVRNKCESVTERFLQISKTDRAARKYAAQVQTTIEKNVWLTEDFGDIRDTSHWLQTEFDCKKQIIDKAEKDHTYEMVGVLGAITGGHFDHINLDDPLDDENTRTTERMDTIENWFWGTIWNLRENYTKFRITGTRKNRRDLYNTCLKSPIWHKNIERSIIKYPMVPDPKNPDRMVQGWLYLTTKGRHIRGFHEITHDESIVDVELLTDDYEVLWPSAQSVNDDGEPIMEDNGQPRLFGWGIRELLLDRAASGSVVFDREKQNEISAEEGAIFRVDWLRLFDNDMIYLNDQDGHYYLIPEVAQNAA